MRDTDFRLTKIFYQAHGQLPLYSEIFGGINFRQCGKLVAISSMYSLIQDQKNCMIKISPMRADGEIGENFLLAKFSTYTTLDTCTV